MKKIIAVLTIIFLLCTGCLHTSSKSSNAIYKKRCAEVLKYDPDASFKVSGELSLGIVNADDKVVKYFLNSFPTSANYYSKFEDSKSARDIEMYASIGLFAVGGVALFYCLYKLLIWDLDEGSTIGGVISAGGFFPGIVIAIFGWSEQITAEKYLYRSIEAYNIECVGR